MKFWIVDYHLDDAPSGSVREHFTSERAARARMRELRREYPLDANGNPPDATAFAFVSTAPQSHDVPTTRAALCAYLNREACTK